MISQNECTQKGRIKMTKSYSKRTNRIVRAIKANAYIVAQTKDILELKADGTDAITIDDRTKLIEAFGEQMFLNLDAALEIKMDEVPEH